MDTTDLFLDNPRLRAARPLLGLTVLVVDDSRFACDAVRLLCLHSGARMRRADCIHSARRHLQVYRPSAILIDIGLPDGSGLQLIEDLNAVSPRIEAILATSGNDGAKADALAAGADGFLAKPLDSIAQFQNAILAALPSERQPKGPRVVSNTTIKPDPLAYRDDLAQAAHMMEECGKGWSLEYLNQFLVSLSRSAGDETLQRAAARLSDASTHNRPVQSHLAEVAALVQQRLSDRIAV